MIGFLNSKLTFFFFKKGFESKIDLYNGEIIFKVKIGIFRNK